jgi:hypothetical protein
MFEAAHQLVGMAGLTSLQSGIPVVSRKKVHTSDVNVEEVKHYEHVLARLAYEVIFLSTAAFLAFITVCVFVPV